MVSRAQRRAPSGTVASQPEGKMMHSKTAGIVRRQISMTLILGLMLAMIPLSVVRVVSAEGLVGDGTPESCTDTALDTALAGGGLVTFDCGPNPVTIALSSAKIINVNTTIDGGDLVALSGENVGGVLWVDEGVSLTVLNLTVSGASSDAFGAIVNAGGNLNVLDSTISGNSSSGIRNAPGGTADIRDSVISNNSTSEDGGGVVSSGLLTITNSTISDNYADDDGGGISSFNSLTITGSTVSGNSSAGSGGGISHTSLEPLTILSSTISGNNSSLQGGGISVTTAEFRIETTTISGNHAKEAGGGMRTGATVGPGSKEIVNSTVTGNTSDIGGSGIYNIVYDITISSTIVAHNPNGNCLNAVGGGGLITSIGYNLNDDDTCSFTEPTDIVNTPANLGSLADNGGQTLTHLPQAGSPAIDNGPATCTSPDQRGVARPQGTACDIGAVEVVRDTSPEPEPPPPTREIQRMVGAGMIASPVRGYAVVGFKFDRGSSQFKGIYLDAAARLAIAFISVSGYRDPGDTNGTCLAADVKYRSRNLRVSGEGTATILACESDSRHGLLSGGTFSIEFVNGPYVDYSASGTVNGRIQAWE